MSEVKDPKIKLFGKTIELPETSATAVTAEEAAKIGEAAQCCDAGGEDSLSQDPPCSSNSNMLEDRDAEDEESNKSQSSPNLDDTKEESSDELKDSNPTPPLTDESKTEEDQSETDNAQEKTLKKPDKILPCPRCNSMDTKFCYFNNYNVNQPRHFCKNCQRYWTAGGTMRNVPVGAGRRKNKTATSQFCHLTVPNGAHPNGTVLTFNPDSPLCESMVSVLNIADKNRSRSGAHDPVSNIEKGDAGCGSNEEMGRSGMSGPGPNYNPFPQPCFTGAPWTSDETGRLGMPDPGQNYNPFPQPCYPGALWPYPFPFNPARFPLPFYSTLPPYWSSVALPGSWNVPWAYPPMGPMSPSSGPNSKTLGKHSRDETILKPANQEEEKENASNLWVPKTLRIDELGDAAKSSIWATLGIKNERRNDSIGGGGLVRALQSQSKGEEKMKDRETSTILQANPAALSRSLQFHEST